MDAEPARRRQTALTREQTDQLETEFGIIFWINDQEQSDIATRLGTTERQVKLWFKNRRRLHREYELQRSLVVENSHLSGQELSDMAREQMAAERSRLHAGRPADTGHLSVVDEQTNGSQNENNSAQAADRARLPFEGRPENMGDFSRRFPIHPTANPANQPLHQIPNPRYAFPFGIVPTRIWRSFTEPATTSVVDERPNGGGPEDNSAEIPSPVTAEITLPGLNVVPKNAEVAIPGQLLQAFAEPKQDERETNEITEAEEKAFQIVLKKKMTCDICATGIKRYRFRKCFYGMCRDCTTQVIKVRPTKTPCPHCRHPHIKFLPIILPRL